MLENIQLMHLKISVKRECEDHVKKLEDMYWAKDGLNFSEQQRVVINLMETSDSE